MQTLISRHAPARSRSLVLDDLAQVDRAADALAGGAVVVHGFGSGYAISARPDAATVRRVNQLKGRPLGQAGGVTTTRRHIPDFFDWCRLPDGLTRRSVLELIDALLSIGPFGFRGPAATMPSYLTDPDGGVLTTQLMAPGYDCPSNAFIARALARIPDHFLFCTSATRSRRDGDANREPSHERTDGLAARLAAEPDVVTLRRSHRSAASRAYPLHTPAPPTILAFHRSAGLTEQGRLRLIVERNGSLPLDHLRRIVGRFDFDVVLGPNAGHRRDEG